MGVFAELWFLTVPAVLVAFVVFVILNSIFNPKPDPSAGHHARGPASSDTIGSTGSSSSDSFYFIGDSVSSSAGLSDSTSSSPDFDSGSGSGGGGSDSSGSSDSGGGSTSD